MKKILFAVALTMGLNASAQFEAGTYVNSVGQVLKISNVTSCCFDVEVKWGVQDEWGCLFEFMENVKFKSPTEAYSGDDAEWPNITFKVEGKTIDVEASPEYIGMDCIRYGDSTSDTYTSFKRK